MSIYRDSVAASSRTLGTDDAISFQLALAHLPRAGGAMARFSKRTTAFFNMVGRNVIVPFWLTVRLASFFRCARRGRRF